MLIFPCFRQKGFIVIGEHFQACALVRNTAPCVSDPGKEQVSSCSVFFSPFLVFCQIRMFLVKHSIKPHWSAVFRSYLQILTGARTKMLTSIDT